MAGPSYSLLIRRMVRIGAAFAAVVIYGTVGYIVLEGWPFLDALYMTITTMTTVGFREVNELDTGGRLFTLTVVVLGVGTALIGISLLAAAIAEAELGGLTRRRRMAKRIEALREHFIVCAYGRVGRAAVRELQAAGVDFVVIDPKDELQGRMERDGVPFMMDDPSLEPVLRRARVEAARGLICAVDSDATNVFITLAARSLNPDLFIVARASEPDSYDRLERAGADRVVSPYVSSGRHMVRMAWIPPSWTSSARRRTIAARSTSRSGGSNRRRSSSA
jgi:voltage-gated potassium channel